MKAIRHRSVNLDALAKVAEALGDLNRSIVFVGGAVVSIYADDDAADEVRPTQDIDLVLGLAKMNEHKLNSQLAERGFHLDIHSQKICTYRYNGIPVDIMSTGETMHSPTNRWYTVGFDSIQTIEVMGVPIRVLSAPCFLATKFEAYNRRGNGDYRLSHDIEDILYIIDNREMIVEELKEADPSIQFFVKSEIRKILNSPNTDEIVSSHLQPIALEIRYPMLLKKLTEMAK